MRLYTTKHYFSITYYSIYLRRKGTTMVWERANFSVDSVLLDQLLRGWIKGSNECKGMYHKAKKIIFPCGQPKVIPKSTTLCITLKDHMGRPLTELSENQLEQERKNRENAQVIPARLQVQNEFDGPFFIQKKIPFLNSRGQELIDKTLCITIGRDYYGKLLTTIPPYYQVREWQNRESIQVAKQGTRESKMLELEQLVGPLKWKKANDSFNKRCPNFVYNGHIPLPSNIDEAFYLGKRYKSYHEYISDTPWICSEKNIYMSIADSVTELPAEVFKDCDTIKRVTIHDKVTKIGKGAFAGCTNLIHVRTNLSLWPQVLENVAAEENSLQQLFIIVRNNLDSILQLKSERLERPNKRKREENEVDAFEDNAIHSVDSDSIAQNLEQVPSCSSTSDDAPLPF